MKAYTPVDLSLEIDKTVAKSFEDARKAVENAPKRKELAPLFRRLSHFYETRVSGYGPTIYLTVDRLSDVEPALHMIEDELKVTFNKTEDIAGSTWAQREFKAEGLPFSLRVEPRLKDPTCRVVEDGFETVKKFKVVCDGEETTA